MMDEQDYLFLCLSEECSEVSQRVSKAMRFSLDVSSAGTDSH